MDMDLQSPRTVKKWPRWRIGAVLALLILAQLTFAAERPPEWLQRVEALAWDTPAKAMEDAQLQLASADAYGDQAAQLAASMLFVTAANALNNYPIVEKALARAVPLAATLHDEAAQCHIFTIRSAISQAAGRTDEANFILDEALVYAKSHRMDWCVARAYSHRASIYSDLARPADVLALLIQAHAMFEAEGDKPWLASVLSDMCWVERRNKDDSTAVGKAIEHCVKALSYLNGSRMRYLASAVNHNLSGAYLAAGRLVEARSHVGEAARLAEEAHLVSGSAFVARMDAVIAMEDGRFADAVAPLTRARGIFLATGNDEMVFHSTLLRAAALAQVGRRDESLQDLAGVLKMSQNLKNSGNELVYLQSAIDIHEKLGNLREALDSAKRLRRAERVHANVANTKLATELTARFETRQKEAENRLLRAQTAESDARRLALSVALLASLAMLGSMAVYLFYQRRQKRRFAELAAGDELTGIPNRRHILELARTILADRRSRGRLWIALLDIDHFKRVNDTYGHAVGDAALRIFAQNCREHLREHDHVGRFGGEEFLLLVEGGSDAALAAIFERLRAGLLAKPVPGMASTERLSFSMGGGWVSELSDLDAAIARVDAALYRAKHAGRDRLELARLDEVPLPPPVTKTRGEANAPASDLARAEA
jgi:diguanylate cyclase (GGDEF)-like protein